LRGPRGHRRRRRRGAGGRARRPAAPGGLPLPDRGRDRPLHRGRRARPGLGQDGAPAPPRVRRRENRIVGRGAPEVGGHQKRRAPGEGRGEPGVVDARQRVEAPARGDGGVPDNDEGREGRLRLARCHRGPGQARRGGLRAEGRGERRGRPRRGRGGDRRSPVRGREPRSQAGRRPGERTEGREPEVPAPLPRGGGRSPGPRQGAGRGEPSRDGRLVGRSQAKGEGMRKPAAGVLAAALAAALPVLAFAREKPRARDLGVPFEGTPGTVNAITDVKGVEVGHSTIVKGEGKLVVGQGPVRTGVTAVLPRGKSLADPVFAGWFSLNGNGEMTGTTWVEESGFLEGPVMITNTHSVGVVRDAVIAWRV